MTVDKPINKMLLFDFKDRHNGDMCFYMRTAEFYHQTTYHLKELKLFEEYKYVKTIFTRTAILEIRK